MCATQLLRLQDSRQSHDSQVIDLLPTWALLARLRRRVRVSSSTQMATASKAKRMLSLYDFHIFLEISSMRPVVRWSSSWLWSFPVLQRKSVRRPMAWWQASEAQRPEMPETFGEVPRNCRKSVARSRPWCLCMCRGFLQLALMQLVNRIILFSERWSQALPQSCLLHILQLLSCLS